MTQVSPINWVITSTDKNTRFQNQNNWNEEVNKDSGWGRKSLTG